MAAKRKASAFFPRGEVRAAWLFLLPSLVILGGFFLVPIVAGLALSFTDFDLYSLADLANLRLSGLRNYADLLGDPLFWKAMRNTFVFVFVGGPLTLAVALTAANLVNARLARGKGFFRTAFFAPYVTTLVAVAIVFRYLYHPRFGLLNWTLGKLGLPPIDWLGDTRWALFSIILLAVWKNFGYAMILFVAGLRNIPTSLYEAARVEGATWYHQFRSITIPMLAPTFLFIGVLTTIGYFQFFPEPYVMTRGGPLNATLSVGLLMYREGFTYWNMGYAASVAFVMFLVILALTAIQFRLQRGKGEA
jgi:multiple sugar transport system permease protein